MPAADLLDAYRSIARSLLARAHAPFSGRREAVVAVLSDGDWVPGVRVESASYSLVIPATLNAVSTAAALGRDDLVAIVAAAALTPADHAWLDALPAALAVHADDARAHQGALPAPRRPVSPFLPERDAEAPAEGVSLARRLAPRAVVPESSFPVACVFALPDGRLVPGVNVEGDDWSRVLCAERNALGTLASYGLAAPVRAYLSCLRAPGCTPCGACRQLLVELAPEAELWMDQGQDAPAASSPAELLPGAFGGDALGVSPSSRGADDAAPSPPSAS